MARTNSPRELPASIQFDASGFDDRAVGRQVALHLLAEEAYTDNGGHQPVTGAYAERQVALEVQQS